MTLVFIPCANCVSLCLPILLRTYKVYLKIKSGPRYIDPWVPDIGYGPRVNDPDAREKYCCRCHGYLIDDFDVQFNPLKL